MRFAWKAPSKFRIIRRASIGGILAATLMLATTSGAAVALGPTTHGEGGHLSAEAEASVRASYDQMGVPKDDQDRVIQNFLNGRLPESMTGGTPVSTVTSQVGGYSQTVRHFSDGSASKSTVELPVQVTGNQVTGNSAASVTNPNTSMRSITQCQSYAGAGYWRVDNCRIATDQAFFSVWFYADLYEGAGGTFYSQINNLRGLGGSSVVGTMSNPSLFLLKQQDGYGEAKATGQYNFDAPFVSGFAAVTLHLSYTNAWDTSP
ncbi:hypothetical protein [Psychromicrobium xiongbiense]|uniref:hypothetical protein n=1 Tax=Psychromicrobium xiongbiense TaxID=3051184 RepID=UPI00255343B5|nr:hypothetical protein [Psychromicrobium sp. YIM S02556]